VKLFTEYYFINRLNTTNSRLAMCSGKAHIEHIKYNMHNFVQVS